MNGNFEFGAGEPPGVLKPAQRVGAGRFTLMRRLADRVWLAQDKQAGAAVALKFPLPGLADRPGALEDLRRETERSRQLVHPNIIQIHDLHCPGDEPPFIAMECVEGPNLHTLRLEQPGRVLPWKFLAPLADQLCDALEYAHGQRVLHGDLKPARLLLAPGGRLKVAGFGIATASAGNSPPDSVIPHVTDDIRALGATLHELLTGEAAVEPEPAGLKLPKNVPAPVVELIVACLAEDPEDRPPAMREVRSRLGDYGRHPRAASTSVNDSPRTAPWLERITTLWRTNKRLKWTLICAAVFLAGSAVWVALRRS